MAGLGHIGVGLATGRLRAAGRTGWSLALGMGWFSALAMLPDVDVLGFRLGIAYAAPFGHRGALHSLVFATAVGAVVAAVQAWRRQRWVSSGLTALWVVASHGLLDAATDGGLGVALLWPFSQRRFFWPSTPIPVSPIGRGVLTERGVTVALTELLIFSPLFVYAFWPRRRPNHEH